jgi:hypothetical protein
MFLMPSNVVVNPILMPSNVVVNPIPCDLICCKAIMARITIDDLRVEISRAWKAGNPGGAGGDFMVNVLNTVGLDW